MGGPTGFNPTDPPGSGDGDAGSTSGEGGAVETTSLTGRVSIAVSADLQTLVVLDDTRVEVTAESPDGFESTATVSGTDEFELEVHALPVRVSLEKLTGPADVLTTIQWVNDNEGTVNVLMVERTVLQDIMDNLAMGATTLVEGRAHAFLSFVNPAGQPLDGVNVELADTTVAYDIGTFYTDVDGADGETAELGRALILNAEADAFPGEFEAINVLRAGQRSRVDVLLAGDAVTLQTIRL